VSAMIEVSLVYVATSELVLETSHGTAFSNRKYQF